MAFLTLSNTDIHFPEKKVVQRTYTIAEGLPTIKRVEFIDKKKFAKAVLNEDVKAFLIHVSSLNLGSMTIYPARKPWMTLLFIKKVTILTEYANFIDILSKKSKKMPSERRDINKHDIKLVDKKKSLYRLIYSQDPIELESLKTYIKKTWQTVLFTLLSFLPVLRLFFHSKSR